MGKEGHKKRLREGQPVKGKKGNVMITQETFEHFDVMEKNGTPYIVLKPEGPKIHFDTPEMYRRLLDCMNHFIAKIRAGINHLPDSGYWSDRLAAVIDTLYVTKEAFVIGVVLERDLHYENSGKLFLSMEVAAPFTDWFSLKTFITYGTKGEVLDYLSRPLNAQAEMLKAMKGLMVKVMDW